MYFQGLLFFTFLCGVLSATPNITKPPNESIINAGDSFQFSYSGISEYGHSGSSYNYTVWLFTQPPSSFAIAEDFAIGYYFGRYGSQNQPGNPYPTSSLMNLTMPNLETLGHGSGGPNVIAENATFYLAVIEEYTARDGSLGFRMSLTYNHIRYNVTP